MRWDSLCRHVCQSREWIRHLEIRESVTKTRGRQQSEVESLKEQTMACETARITRTEKF